MNTWNQVAAISMGLSVLVSGSAYAKKPDVAEHGYGHSISHDKKDGHKHDEKHDKKSHSSYFSQDRAKKVNDYYSARASKAKHCPPGLAKKNNGCQAPGQAKKWVKGKPLPADVVYYNVPNALLYELGKTPVGQKIVRVGEDILLINAVTGLVIDVVESVFSQSR